MKSKAIAMARTRLKRAERDLEALRTASSLEQIEEAWGDILDEFDAINEKLRAGVAGSNKSVHWFGQHKGRFRSDPLLDYLHHARACDFHRIDDTVGQVISIGNVHGAIWFSGFNPDGTPQVISASPGATMESRSYVEASRVTTKDGREIDPPHMHLGKFIGRPTPVNLASRGLDYYRELVRQAATLDLEDD